MKAIKEFFTRIFGRKGVRYGSTAIAFTALFLAAVVLVNVLAGVLTNKFNLHFDLTDKRLYEISDETKKFLSEELDRDILITVFAPEYYYIDADAYAPIREVLLRYITLSGEKIKVRYVDPYTNPEIVEKYTTFGNISRFDIVVESDLRYKKLTTADLYEIRTDYDSEESYISGLQAEQKLSSAISYCIVDKLPTALRVQGHGEELFSKLNALLTSANYSVDSINLSVEDIPDDCSMLVICSPERDFTVEEIEKLDDYFARNGNALIFYDINVPELPVFERFMADWGVAYDQVLVADSTRAISQPTNIAPSFISHEMTDSIASSNEYVIAPASRAISKLYETYEWRTVHSILVSSSTSYGKSYTSGETIDTTKQEGDIAGPFNICVLTEQDVLRNLEHNYSRILFCSSGMVADDILSTDTFLNSKLILQALNYMNEDADSIVVSSKYYQSSTLSIVAAQAKVVFWVLCVILPVGILTTGIVVWARRRNK